MYTKSKIWREQVLPFQSKHKCKQPHFLKKSMKKKVLTGMLLMDEWEGIIFDADLQLCQIGCLSTERMIIAEYSRV